MRFVRCALTSRLIHHVGAAAIAGAVVATIPTGGLLAQTGPGTYRVAGSPGVSDFESAVDASLERHVNALAAAGYEVAAILGGASGVIDGLLLRKPYVAGLVDHSGHTAVVMRRAPGAPAVRREYRLLHTRTALGVDELVAPLGAQGFVLSATAHDGPVFHAAFERREPTPTLDYRVYRNRGRTSWMDQLQKDATAIGRLRRVVPMALDAALVELGAEASPPGALEWVTIAAFKSASLESTLAAKAAAGFRVQLVRLRQNDLGVLLVRPAGPAGPAATYDVDDGPWGGPCSRGQIVGADGYTDGDVYCVAENPGGGVSNRGADTVLQVRTGADRPLLDAPSCVERARLRAPRTAHARMVVAQQIERFLDAKVPAGYRVTRLLAVQKADGESRLVMFSTDAPAAAASGPPADTVPAPQLTVDLDGPLDADTAVRQRDLSERFARLTGVQNQDAWLDVLDAAGQRSVVLSGCVSTATDKRELERAVQTLLQGGRYAGFRLRNDLLVELFK